MNIRAQLLLEHSKTNTKRIREHIGRDKVRLEELMNCFFAEEYRVSQRSAMVVSDVFDNAPALLDPYIAALIKNLKSENHVAIKRNTLRVLQFIEIPENQISELFDHCLENIVSVKEPIAVKAFSMTVLLNICKRFTELKHEVIPLLELELERNESAGVNNRGSKILKALNKL